MSADDRQVGGDHYQAMGVQPWEALWAWLTKPQFIGFLIGSAVANAPGKGGRQDIEKAIHCLEKALEVIDSPEG